MTEKLSDQILNAHQFLREQPRLTGCISYLQRRLSCGYNRAALVLAFLEDSKIISIPDHGGFRRWLMDGDAAVTHLKAMI